MTPETRIVAPDAVDQKQLTFSQSVHDLFSLVIIRHSDLRGHLIRLILPDDLGMAVAAAVDPVSKCWACAADVDVEASLTPPMNART